MKDNSENLFYDSPRVEIVEIEAEGMIASSSGNVENPLEGDESDW